MLRGRFAWLSHGCHVCPWGWTFGEPQPVIPADSAHGPALLVSVCLFSGSQCHLIWKEIVLNLVSPPKCAIPVLCAEPLGGHFPVLGHHFFVLEDPLHQSKVDRPSAQSDSFPREFEIGIS